MKLNNVLFLHTCHYYFSHPFQHSVDFLMSFCSELKCMGRNEESFCYKISWYFLPLKSPDLFSNTILFSVNFLTLNKLKSLFFLHLITDFALKVNSLFYYQTWSTQIIVHEKFSPFLTMKNIFVFIACYSICFLHKIYLYLKKLFWKLLICFKKSGHKDGRGIGQGDHFLPHKFFKRTF